MGIKPLWAVRYCTVGIDLAMSVEAVVAFTTLAKRLKNERRTWVEGVRRTGNRIGRAGDHSLHNARWHLAKLADDQGGDAHHMRAGHRCALEKCIPGLT